MNDRRMAATPQTIGISVVDNSVVPASGRKHKSKKARAPEQFAEIDASGRIEPEDEDHETHPRTGRMGSDKAIEPGSGPSEGKLLNSDPPSTSTSISGPLLPTPVEFLSLRSPTATKAVEMMNQMIKEKRKKAKKPEPNLEKASNPEDNKESSESAAKKVHGNLNSKFKDSLTDEERALAEERLAAIAQDLAVAAEDAEIAKRLASKMRSGGRLVRTRAEVKEAVAKDDGLYEETIESSSRQWALERRAELETDKRPGPLSIRWNPIDRSFKPEAGDNRYGSNLSSDCVKGQWRMSRASLKLIQQIPSFQDKEMVKWFKERLTIHKPIRTDVIFSKRLEREFDEIFYVSQKIRDLKTQNKIRRELDYMYNVMHSEDIGYRGAELIHGPLHMYLHLYPYLKDNEVNPIICFKRHLKQTTNGSGYFIDQRALMLFASLHIRMYNANWYLKENKYAGDLHTRYSLKCMGFEELAIVWCERRVSMLTEVFEYPVQVPLHLISLNSKFDFDPQGYWKPGSKPNVVIRSTRWEQNDDNLLFEEHSLIVLNTEEAEMAEWQREKCTRYWNYQKGLDEIDAYAEYCRENYMKFVSETARELMALRKMDALGITDINKVDLGELDDDFDFGDVLIDKHDDLDLYAKEMVPMGEDSNPEA